MLIEMITEGDPGKAVGGRQERSVSKCLASLGNAGDSLLPWDARTHTQAMSKNVTNSESVGWTHQMHLPKGL